MNQEPLTCLRSYYCVEADPQQTIFASSAKTNVPFVMNNTCMAMEEPVVILILSKLYGHARNEHP